MVYAHDDAANKLRHHPQIILRIQQCDDANCPPLVGKENRINGDPLQSQPANKLGVSGGGGGCAWCSGCRPSLLEPEEGLSTLVGGE